MSGSFKNGYVSFFGIRRLCDVVFDVVVDVGFIMDDIEEEGYKFLGVLLVIVIKLIVI